MRVHAQITIKVVYDDASSVRQASAQAKHAADQLVEIGMNEGLWSGSTEMTVDDVQFGVEAWEASRPRGRSGDRGRSTTARKRR